MYTHFGIELTGAGLAAMRQYMADNPRDSRPAHRFNFGSADVVDRARATLLTHDQLTAHVVDLKKVGFPLLDEP